MNASGNWAKFASTSQSQIQGWISQALTKGRIITSFTVKQVIK